MRSINVKKVAAIAAGAAMVGSVISSGLAAVTPSPSLDAVNTLINNIKSNVGDTQVAIGSMGAAVTDGIAGAKIAATLASINYEEVQVSGAIDPSKIGVGTPKVIVETTGGAQTQITPAHFDLTYQGGAPVPTASGIPAGFNSFTNGVTLTPDVLGDVLKKSMIRASISGSSQDIPVQEEIGIAPQTYVRYDEATSPDGHGLFWYAPMGNLTYTINFQAGGMGIPLNGTAYDRVPEVNILGDSYAIDVRKFPSQTVFYAGDRTTINSGEVFTTSGGYTVKLLSVGLTSGNIVDATFQVTDPDGNVDSQTIASKGGFDFFDNKLSVYVESATTQAYIEENVATGQATIRVGTGQLKVQQGLPFPFDERWTVQSVGRSGMTVKDYLQNIVLQYGNVGLDPLDPIKTGDFQGTVLQGLEQGVVIDGPHNQQGVALYNMKLAGFGGSTRIDTSTVTFRGVGDHSAGTDVMQLTYTDPDGVVNSFAPATKKHAFGVANLTWSGFNFVNLTSGTRPWTFANNHTLWFNVIESTTTTPTNYYPVFRLGGVQGTVIEGTYATAANGTWAPGLNSTSIIQYTGPTNIMKCPVDLWAMNKVAIRAAMGGPKNFNCNLMPAINIGPASIMDQSMPIMWAGNVTYGWGQNLITGAWVRMPGVALFENETVVFPGPGGIITHGKGLSWTVIYDGAGNMSYLGSADTYRGMVVINSTRPVGGYGAFPPWDIATAGPGYNTIAYINQATSPLYETDQYQITPWGSELNGAVGNTVTAVVPEAQRNAMASIAATLGEADGGMSLGVGESVSGITVTGFDITPTYTGTAGVSGTYYQPGETINPANLVTTDTAATATYKIVVGGPFVNMLATGTYTGAGDAKIIASGNTVEVAGYLATDTTAAANEFISLLTA